MGFFARLFGIGETDKHETYEERLARMANAPDDMTSAPAEVSLKPVVLPKEEEKKAPDVYHDENGRKLVPEIECERVEPHLSGDESQMDLWATLVNRSSFELEITEVELLNVRDRPGVYLKSGERREVRLYQGGTPKDDVLDDVLFRYKIVGNGDYFEVRNFIDYDFHDGYYVPKAIKQDRPVRDI